MLGVFRHKWDAADAALEGGKREIAARARYIGYRPKNGRSSCQRAFSYSALPHGSFEHILLKNSSTRKLRRKLGTPFSPRADWQTLFDTGGFYGRIFCLSGPFRRGRKFFNRIGS